MEESFDVVVVPYIKSHEPLPPKAYSCRYLSLCAGGDGRRASQIHKKMGSKFSVCPIGRPDHHLVPEHVKNEVVGKGWPSAG